MSPVAILQVDVTGDKSPVFGDKSKELNVFNSFGKSNVPATCRTRVSSMFLHVERLLIFMFTALTYRRACACQARSPALPVRRHLSHKMRISITVVDIGYPWPHPARSGVSTPANDNCNCCSRNADNFILIHFILWRLQWTYKMDNSRMPPATLRA